MVELSNKKSGSSVDLDLDFNFDQYLKVRRQRLEQALESYLTSREPVKLWQSMHYSVLSGGKRLRAILTMAAAESVHLSKLANASSKQKYAQIDPVELTLPLASAIEMVHAMSLIHDDLPCLDNDDLRRGKPTNHVVYGEAMALLAGDGLLMLANEVLLTATSDFVSRQNLLAITLELARATGPSGMVGGQVMDMEMTGAKAGSFDASYIKSIHECKTGALIRFALWSGGKLMDADETQLKSLWRLGEILGLAFQITDDLLDVTGSAESLGKTPGKDLATSKATWVSVYGIEQARTKLGELESEGKQLIKDSRLDNTNCPALENLLQYSIHRNK